MSSITGQTIDIQTRRRADELFARLQDEMHSRIDRLFAALMIFQWVASIAAAYWLSPETWVGPNSRIHIHLWAAVFLGGLITALPIVLSLYQPGRTLTRHVIAVAQMLTSALLIHLSGGRIETHFHVFGSLAFLAFYRDWRVLVTASSVVVVDHLLRGMFWPESVYGVLSAPLWRSLEHGGWVVFEDIILVFACLQSNREMRVVALRTAELESTNERVEEQIVQRTNELRFSELRAKNIIDMATDAFVAMNEAGEIVDWNRQAETIFGWKQSEVLGRPLSQFIVPQRLREDHTNGLQLFLKTLKGPVLNKCIEVPALHRDGREFPIELTISPIRLDSGWLFSAFVRDITARKESQAKLERAMENAEAASQAKGEFLANMSHEIRTPLNGIIGMTELALDTELSIQQREYLGTAKSCADSLLSLINDILDFSKIEAGKLHMESIGFSVRDSIGDTCKSLGLRAHQKGLELAWRVDRNVPEHLLGDPGRVRQVIVNLLGNAVKFTNAGEVIVAVQLESRTDDKVNLHFQVSDTGIGISPEKQELIFNAFEQADSSTTRNYGGTGLGLAIVSRIVALLGGKIWVESKVGRGSTFHFTAEFGLDPNPQTCRSSDDRTCFAGSRVLIVDDNATNRFILTEMLHNWRMAPFAAACGSEAIVAMTQAAERGNPYPLVIVDGQMPGMDGFMLADQLKSRGLVKDSKLVMLSSSAQSSDIQRCRERGFAAYLTKPVKQSELFDMIATVLAAPEQEAAPVKRFVGRSEPSITESNGEKWHILLAEDNPVNQRVASGILEKRGHLVVAVGNGREALQAMAMQRFDLVLMDLQMPEMDGFAATAAIREQEAGTDRHIPIVAMTARAMKGDRECCLEAGMDGYVSKPVNPKALLATLAELVQKTTKTEPSEPDSQAAETNAPKTQPVKPKDAASDSTQRENAAIHFESLMARVENDTALLEEMLELFLETSPKLLTQLEAGVERRDATVVQRAAHGLKGALQNLSAMPSAGAALKLEDAGRNGNLQQADELLAGLKSELERLQTDIQEWSKGVCV
jgi:two-component system sensor histidine kinase/response regulator